MADKLVQPLVLFTVQKLLDMLVEEATFLSDVRGQVKEMEKELQSMQTYLMDADRRCGEGDQNVSRAVIEIRELAYNSEDAIASFVVQVAGGESSSSSTKKKGAFCYNFKSCLSFVKTSRSRHDVGKEMESINKEVASLTGRLKRYKVKQTPVAINPRKEYPTPVEGIVVGLEDQVRMMVDHLKDETRERIVSIYGMGGLGKTTFSKMIGLDVEITQHFDHVAWVCISQQFEATQIWRDILLQFDKTDEKKNATRMLTENELVTKLHSTQMEKKCLVILDDIWEQKDWNRLCRAFPRTTTRGSKIVLTTRKKDVVSHAKDMECYLYPLPFLDGKQCQELLEKKLSPETEEMRNIIKDIVGHCGGLPLAVVLVGGLLAENKSVGAWGTVRKDLSNCLNKGNDLEWGVQNVLALSYQDLPYNLKACFLYLSLFPEDFDIDAESLVQMWIAEGFVSNPAQEEGRKTTLDVGLSYLYELANRCMVQADISKFAGIISSIRLHDLMRDFCRSKAQDENFSQDFGVESSIPSTSAAQANTIRRLAIYNCQPNAEISYSNKQFEHVRSCLLHDQGRSIWDTINSLLKSFKYLKVLHIGMDSLIDSEDIGKLIHLRYLRLPSLCKVSSSLGKLVLLQTLIIQTPYDDIPDVLWKLKHLRYLHLPVWHLHPQKKLRLDGLMKLETLIDFNTSYCDVADLATLPNIRKVRIRCRVKELVNIITTPMFSESSDLLRTSIFDFRGDVETHEEQSYLCQVLACPHVLEFSLFGRVYKEVSFLESLNENITVITLQHCQLMEDPMLNLGKMPNLRELSLSNDSYTGRKIRMVAGSFPQLTDLDLGELRICDWEVEKGAMQCLLRLHIWGCKWMERIPNGLRFITTLEFVCISCTPPLARRLQTGGDDFSIIQHVPDITITEDN